jgi:hypothetical protein
MSAFAHFITSGMVSTRPCRLLSLVISQEASGTGTVRLYDEISVQASALMLEVYLDGDGSQQFRWKGIETDKGLYVEIYSKVDHVTVEWEPIA